MKRALKISAAAIVLGMATGAMVRAEAQAAKDYVKQAQDLFANHDNDGATAKLDLADTELDGVDTDTKATVSAQIKSLRATIASGAVAANADKYRPKLAQAMEAAEGAIGNQVTWPGAADDLKEIFDDPAAQASIPDDIATAKKKFATFSKLNSKKTAVVISGQVADSMKELDAKWAENKPKFADPNAAPGDKSTAIDDMTRAMDDTKQQIAKLAPDSDDAKTYGAHLDKVCAEFTQIALADKAKEVLGRLKESFASYKDECGAGPTWPEYQQNQNDTVEAFNAPKSKGFIARAGTFIKDLDTNDDYKTVAAAPDIKAFVDQLKSDRDKAYSQILQRSRQTVTAAIAAGGDDLSRLKDDVRNALGEDSPDGKALQDSIQKKIDGATASAAGNDEAEKVWYQKMSAAAANAWPAISGKFSPEAGFNPNDPSSFKGKTIKITTDNLVGYRFKPGDFEFATTLNGLPVAAHFDSALKEAIAAVEAKMGRSLGDSDDDGKWTVFAIVTGEKGQMLQKKQAEGDVKVDGQTVGKMTTDYADPVDAPIITIVAAKCGPFVGGKDAGIIQPDGTIAK